MKTFLHKLILALPLSLLLGSHAYAADTPDVSLLKTMVGWYTGHLSSKDKKFADMPIAFQLIKKTNKITMACYGLDDGKKFLKAVYDDKDDSDSDSDDDDALLFGYSDFSVAEISKFFVNQAPIMTGTGVAELRIGFRRLNKNNSENELVYADLNERVDEDALILQFKFTEKKLSACRIQDTRYIPSICYDLYNLKKDQGTIDWNF